MQDVTEFFKETQEAFTIYVVEQRFVVGRGNDYFKSFKGKENYISTEEKIKKRINVILRWIQKNLPNIYDLVKAYMNPTTLDIREVISALCTLFTVHEHQAAGPEVLDPIIIQEGKIHQKYLTQIITLHQKSILRPAIIILLKDNDFDRAKKLLSGCPHGINVKMIRNSGQCEIYKIINQGANNIDEFLDAYALQFFSTCSHTRRDVLMNGEWNDNDLIRCYSPSLFQIRSKILYDEKDDVKNDINNIINSINIENYKNEKDKTLAKSFACMSKLFRVYCNDMGENDIVEAQMLAKDLENEVLLAHVYRYSHFLPGQTREEKQQLLGIAEQSFRKNNIYDHALYCKNNSLIHQFHTDKINVRDFKEMMDDAVYNVPGMVGLSHIFNNTGVAYLLTGNATQAIYYFNKGIERALEDSRTIQGCALRANKMIAQAYSYESVSEKDMRQTLDMIKNGINGRLPYLTALYALNIISIAMHQNQGLALDLMQSYPVKNLVQQGLMIPTMSSGQLFLQLGYLSQHFEHFKMMEECTIPNTLSPVSGYRKEFIVSYGYNPLVFNIWL